MHPNLREQCIYIYIYTHSENHISLHGAVPGPGPGPCAVAGYDVYMMYLLCAYMYTLCIHALRKGIQLYVDA